MIMALVSIIFLWNSCLKIIDYGFFPAKINSVCDTRVKAIHYIAQYYPAKFILCYTYNI